MNPESAGSAIGLPVEGLSHALGAYAPHAMLVAGIALLMVPRWLRFCIAVALIMFGLVGIWPGLLEGAPPVR